MLRQCCPLWTEMGGLHLHFRGWRPVSLGIRKVGGVRYDPTTPPGPCVLQWGPKQRRTVIWNLYFGIFTVAHWKSQSCHPKLRMRTGNHNKRRNCSRTRSKFIRVIRSWITFLRVLFVSKQTGKHVYLIMFIYLYQRDNKRSTDSENVLFEGATYDLCSTHVKWKNISFCLVKVMIIMVFFLTIYLTLVYIFWPSFHSWPTVLLRDNYAEYKLVLF